MSYYVEVMCDERKLWPPGSDKLNNRCATDRGDNPQGYDRESARKQAIEWGWEVRRNYACCPDCAE